MRYVQPKSVTWWAGVFALTVGFLSLLFENDYRLGQISDFIMILAGGANSSPAGLMSLGAGLIGMRDKLERVFRND